MPTTSDAAQLAAEKLASSGLTQQDAEQLRITTLTAQQSAKLGEPFKSLPAIRFEYLDPHGTPIQDWPESDPYFRIRYLAEPPKGFDTAGPKKKPPSYVQPRGTAPVAYYPQNQLDWPALINDPTLPIIITEGELKAAKACKEGFPAIGLGGVDGWISKRRGWFMLPSLECVVWRKRRVLLCWDSDFRTNPNVCRALKSLAEELQRRGAYPHVVLLPELPELGGKTGLDDFLTFGGDDAAEQFTAVLREAPALGVTEPLWGLNERYTYVQAMGMVVNHTDPTVKYKPRDFTGHAEATAQYLQGELDANGTVTYKPVSAATAWIGWPLRLSTKALTYAPGAERFTPQPDQPDDVPLLNTWPGWGCHAQRGSVKLFRDLVDHLFTGAEPAAKKWFLQWCAYPLQHPGTKMFSSAVVHGTKQGTGKSLIGYTLGAIYGRNFTEISQRDLHSGYTAWAESKQFVMGDDVTGSDKRTDADYLKKLITQKEMRVNIKYVPEYTVPDCINYYFTSNQPDAFFLDDDDRRFFIHEVTADAMPREFFAEYDEWLHRGPGPSAVFHYLRGLDLTGFNPNAAAHQTHAKTRMIDAGRSDLAAWVRSMLATPDATLCVGEIKPNRDLFTSRELLLHYDAQGDSRVTATGMGRELSRAGVGQVCKGAPIKNPETGTQARYYAIRNPEKWLGAAPGAVIEHLFGEAARPKKRRGKKF